MEVERALKLVAGASAADLQRAIDGIMSPGERSRLNSAVLTLVLHGRETLAFEDGGWELETSLRDDALGDDEADEVRRQIAILRALSGEAVDAKN